MPSFTPPKPVEQLRILELGGLGYFHYVIPDQVTWIRTVAARLKESDPKLKFTWKFFFELKRRIAAGEFDLIIVTQIGIPLYRGEHFFLKRWFYFLRRLLTKFYSLACYLVFFVDLKKTKLAVIDTWDDPIIRSQYFLFFPKLNCYFKRELPPNHWQTFLFTSRRFENLGNIRKEPSFVQIRPRLRPLPMEPYTADQLRFAPPAEKTSDIFYVGLDMNPIRQKGTKLLEKFRAEGWRVDMPTTRLSKDEFRQRLAASWLAFSPQGDGWQCHRTGEAIIHGAVPVMNYPVVETYQPLRDGVHAFYYGVEEEHLLEVLRSALADKARLVQMLAAARAHLATWYSAPAVLTYVWTEVTNAPVE